MSLWSLIPAAIGVGSSIMGASSQNAQNKTQKKWNEYNATVQYSVDVNNIKAQQMITEVNAAMTMFAADATNQANDALIEYNVGVIRTTALYNDLLAEEDLANMWSQAELDMELIGLQRARERGSIEAAVSASGTVMGTGSNADVIVDQKTQEALDLFVVRTGADQKASQIANSRMQGLYEAEQTIKKIEYEGRVNSLSTKLDASMRSSAMLTEGVIRNIADLTSAETRRQTGVSSANLQYRQNKSQISSNLVSGIFGSVGQGFSAYMDTKQPGSAPTTTSETSNRTPTIIAGNYKIKR